MIARRVSARPAVLAACAVAVCVVAGCSSSSSPRDDRARVRSMIAAYAADLQRVGLIATKPSPTITACGDGHSANLQWAAPVTPAHDIAAAKAQYETEQNVLGQAVTALKLGDTRSLSTGGDSEVAQLFRTKDGSTTLMLTVPHGQYVRIDGSVSC